jgi:hypothetical protein
MKRYVFFLAPSVAAACSVGALAAGQPSAASLAAQSCKSQQAQLGATFKTTYGTKSLANAYGKCVSKATQAAQAALQNAAQTCTAEQAQAPADFAAQHNGQSFVQVYGGNQAKGKGADANAYGKCVSTKATAASQQSTQNTVAAAKACKAELAASKTNFAAAYGSKANAFGICVSRKASGE